MREHENSSQVAILCLGLVVVVALAIAIFTQTVAPVGYSPHMIHLHGKRFDVGQ